ncbi:MAG: class I SAM-dependent methyltransferase [Bacteroidales bacterium]|nr:class I SAM-dependent methyltransferase [Bacteroidales bacterium]
MNPKLLAKKVIHRFSKFINKKTDFLVQNKKKRIKKCYICGEEFENFYKYRINKELDLAFKYFEIVGSDIENFGCYYCNCNDRDRHLFMYFDKLNIWDKFKNARILHFAPEKPMENKIEQLLPVEYIKCDLHPKDNWRKIDITKIDFEADYFDILICNHVIEHIPDHLQALKEISRVLKKTGFAILQTPYSKLLYNHFEDPNINTDALRLTFYGQEDHVRIVSKRQFVDELSLYFTLNIVKNENLFSNEECYRFGVNNKEDLIMVFNSKMKE